MQRELEGPALNLKMTKRWPIKLANSEWLHYFFFVCFIFAVFDEKYNHFTHLGTILNCEKKILCPPKDIISKDAYFVSPQPAQFTTIRVVAAGYLCYDPALRWQPIKSLSAFHPWLGVSRVMRVCVCVVGVEGGWREGVTRSLPWKISAILREDLHAQTCQLPADTSSSPRFLVLS